MHMDKVIPKQVLNYLIKKKLQPSFNYQEVWKEEHGHAFTVAKMLEADLLMETKALLVESLAHGKTFTDFQRELRPRLIERGWWGVQERINPNTGQKELVQLGSNQRLKTIYYTNMRTARAAGQWQRIERNKQSHPYLIYELGSAREHRPEHISWHGLVLPVEDKFWNTHYPPNGWGCKCRVRSVSKYAFERLQKTGITAREPQLDSNGLPTGRFTNKKVSITTKAPKVTTRDVVNKHTGEVMKVPKGIDAGWDYNMGKGTARTERQQAQLVTKARRADKVLSEPLDTQQVPAIYSSVKNVTTEKLTACLKQLPESSKPQVDQLFEFLKKKQTKSVFIKAQEMNARALGAKQAEQAIGAYLGRTDVLTARSLFTTRERKALGFTHPSFEHIVIKVRSTSNLNKVNPEQLRQVVSTAITKYKGNTKPYSRYQYDDRAYAITAEVGENTGLVTTYLHELGHQIHYYAGEVDAPKGAKYLTQYSQKDHKEYHAESFVAWLLDRDALHKHDPVTAKHMDNVISKAIKAQSK